jgi:phosphoribosylanthranilate isomerase
MRPLLKVCGLMREEDVLLCCRKGVEICGFVTEYPVPVPWNLSRERCAALLPLVRSGAKSCIVTGGAPDKLRDLALPLRPDLIQLHAGESLAVTAALAGELAPLGIGVIKTVPASAEARLREFGASDPGSCGRLLREAGVWAALVDARGPENAARSGLQADPELFRAVRDGGGCFTILGGGVRSANCAGLIRQLHPAALDVMSGVELAPGQKSEELLDGLLNAMEEAGEADSSTIY